MESLNIKSLVVFAVSLSVASLIGCQSSVKSVERDKETPTFSISSGQSDSSKCEVAGEMKDCNIYWTVSTGILTHRQDCTQAHQKYTPLVLNAMAKSLKSSCPLNIKYVRMTSKDDVQSERRMARMMSQSKLWKSYAKAPVNKRKKFSNAFLKKVVETKGLFNEVAQALNSTGYQFKIDKVDVADFSPIHQSRHFNSLRSIKTDQFLVPENVRLVWLDSRFRPKQIRPKNGVTNKQGQIPTELPNKVVR